MPQGRTYTRIMSGGRRGASIEAATSLSEGNRAALESLAPRRDYIDRLQAELAYVEQITGCSVDRDAAGRLIKQAESALARVENDGEDAVLSHGQVSGFEAVIKTDGSRPVLFVVDGFIDLKQPSVGEFGARLSIHKPGVQAVCAAVGRVDDPGARPLGYQGTCFMVGQDVVMTNRHVLHAVSRKRDGVVVRDEHGVPVLKDGIAIDFHQEVGPPRTDRRFPVTRVLFEGAAGNPRFLNDDRLNFDTLDMALLQLGSTAGQRMPEPLVFKLPAGPPLDALSSQGQGVHLVGFPGNAQSTTPDLFSKLFAGVKGFKRLAPGEIMERPGGLPAGSDPRRWILTHDCSTLGGNSGSAVVNLDFDGRTTLGLHFAGYHERRNWAHAFLAIGPQVDEILTGRSQSQ